MQMRPSDSRTREIAALEDDYQIDKDFASIAEEIDGLLVISVASSATEVAITASAKFDLTRIAAPRRILLRA